MKRKNPQDRIIQRSIGFTLRQLMFFDEFPEFKPDKFIREQINKQIADFCLAYEEANKFLPKQDE